MPRAAAFGIPLPTMEDVSRNWRKRMRGEQTKIPVVPRITDDGKLVKGKKVEPSEQVTESLLPKDDVTKEERLEERRLRESEERLKEFERQKRLGMTGAKGVRGTQDGERVEAEEVDNIVYPRDVVGTKFRKDKVKYKYDVYRSLVF